jgi:hypothetical protein
VWTCSLVDNIGYFFSFDIVDQVIFLWSCVVRWLFLWGLWWGRSPWCWSFPDRASASRTSLLLNQPFPQTALVEQVLTGRQLLTIQLVHFVATNNARSARLIQLLVRHVSEPIHTRHEPTVIQKGL